MEKISLFYNDLAAGGTSDKEYHVQLVKARGGWSVNFQFGRRGGSLQSSTKTPTPVPLPEAQRIFKSVVAEKFGKGYRPPVGSTATIPLVELTPQQNGAISRHPGELLEEIPRVEAAKLILSPDYWLQVKVDGFRRQIEKKANGETISYARGRDNGPWPVRPLPREIVQAVKSVPGPFFVDGEMVGKRYVGFEQLEGADDYTRSAYAIRFTLLEKLFAKADSRVVSVVETWKTPREKQAALAMLMSKRAEGAAFKKISAPFRGGRNGQHKKYKFWKNANCRIMALRLNGKDNAALGILDARGKWIDVGRASTIGKGNLQVGDVVEVKFLYATKANRLYEPSIRRKRTDQSERECIIDQLRLCYKEGVEAA